MNICSEGGEKMKARFLMDCYGHFQIEVDGQRSPPALYESIASLKKDGKEYMGVCGYFSGTLPTECVLEVIEIPSTAEDADVCNLFRPEEPCTHGEVKERKEAKSDSTTHKS